MAPPSMRDEELEEWEPLAKFGFSDVLTRVPSHRAASAAVCRKPEADKLDALSCADDTLGAAVYSPSPGPQTRFIARPRGRRCRAQTGCTDSAALKKPEALSCDLARVQVIVGDTQPICRLALVTLLGLMGARTELITECGDIDEVVHALRVAQVASGPLLVFLGKEGWVSALASAGGMRRKPFVVSTSVDRTSHSAFDVILPSLHSKDDLGSAIKKYLTEYGDYIR